MRLRADAGKWSVRSEGRALAENLAQIDRQLRLDVLNVVTRVSGVRMHVQLTIEGADESIAGLFRNDQPLSV